MLKRKFKTILSVLLMTVISLSLIACGKEEYVEPKIEAEFAEHQISVYLLDSWKETNEETQEIKYHTSLLVNSETFYSQPSIDDITYLVGTEYKPLSEVTELSDVKVSNVVDNESATCTYVYFTTSEIIDLKKIYVEVKGTVDPTNVNLTREEYKAKMGNLDGYVWLTAGVEERDVELSKVLPWQTKIDENVIVLWDDKESKFYYENNPQSIVLDESAAYVMLDVVPLTNTDCSVLVEAFMQEGKIGDYKDGKFIEWENNNAFKIFSDIDEKYVCVGYTTDSLSKHDAIPTAISLTSNGHEYIIRLFE